MELLPGQHRHHKLHLLLMKQRILSFTCLKNCRILPFVKSLFFNSDFFHSVRWLFTCGLNDKSIYFILCEALSAIGFTVMLPSFVNGVIKATREPRIDLLCIYSPSGSITYSVKKYTIGIFF